jgi:hypothetical protein
MRAYHIEPSTVAAAIERRQKTALHYVVTVGAAASLVISGWALALERYQVMVLMPAFALALAFVYRRNLARDAVRVSKTTYELGEDSIRQSGDGFPLALARAEVTSICESPLGAIIIRTDRLLRFLYIRHDVENRAELRAALAQWAPIEPRSVRWIELWPRISQAIALVLAPLAVASSISANPWVVVPSGLALIAVVAGSLVAVYHQGGKWWHKAIGWAAMFWCAGLATKMVDAVRFPG